MAAAVNEGDLENELVEGDLESDNELVGDFLITTERLHDCFFIVGNTEQIGSSERIGAVKACLSNHSRVFRNMLHDSLLAEKSDIKVPDIEPDTFRLLLRHCYGKLDSCRQLSSEEAVKLCYAAEKYLMSSLKKKVAERLKPECVPEIFPALHCLVTYNVKDLEPYVAKMVQEQTDKVLSSEGLVEMDVDSIVFIARQEPLNCSETDLWRAVVTWAAHKVRTVEGTSMREWMIKPLKHLRLMTLTYEDLCKEVLPTKVLTLEEFTQVCERSNQESQTICCLMEKRMPSQCFETVDILREHSSFSTSPYSRCCIVVGDSSIRLESITCFGSDKGDFQNYYGRSCSYNLTVEITRISDYISNSSTENPVVINFSSQRNYYEQFTIPTLVNGEGVTLQANGMYRIFVKAECSLPCWKSPSCRTGHKFSHGKFYCSYIYEKGYGSDEASHIVKFQYSYRR